MPHTKFDIEIKVGDLLAAKDTDGSIYMGVVKSITASQTCSGHIEVIGSRHGPTIVVGSQGTKYFNAKDSWHVYGFQAENTEPVTEPKPVAGSNL